jgi:hypothetical protein
MYIDLLLVESKTRAIMLVMVSVPRFMLGVIPPLILLWIMGILWGVRKDLGSVGPIIIGIFLLTIARAADLLLQYSTIIAALSAVKISNVPLPEVLDSLGDLADAAGVFMLITGFIQSVQYQINKKKQIEELETLLPICATCKKIRKPDNTWVNVEDFLRHVGAPPLTHGICPECKAELLRERNARIMEHRAAEH